MRIIGGKFKGRIIQMPKGVRPTSDKVREAFFEILKGRIEGANFLDLYCGSGAIGIEAFSRGAESVTFVDNSFECSRVLKKNLTYLGVSDLSIINIYRLDAIKAVKVLENASLSFDVVFLDPPYYRDVAKNTLIALSNCAILPRNGIIVAETYKKESLPEGIGVLKKVRTSRYGDTKLEFYQKAT